MASWGVIACRPRVYALVPCFLDLFRVLVVLEEPLVSRLFNSGFSRSRLLVADVPDGVLEPVRAGDCKGESFAGDAACAFSPPVIASEIARSPVLRDFLPKKEWLWWAGEGDARP